MHLAGDKSFWSGGVRVERLAAVLVLLEEMVRWKSGGGEAERKATGPCEELDVDRSRRGRMRVSSGGAGDYLSPVDGHSTVALGA